MKVKCISAISILKKGEVYEVVREDSECYYFSFNPIARWFKYRFTTISDQKNNENEMVATSSKDNDVASIPDWKKWRDVNRLSNQCACGIDKEQCSFHK